VETRGAGHDRVGATGVGVETHPIGVAGRVEGVMLRRVVGWDGVGGGTDIVRLVIVAARGDG
jgi:hypothetical protein